MSCGRLKSINWLSRVSLFRFFEWIIKTHMNNCLFHSRASDQSLPFREQLNQIRTLLSVKCWVDVIFIDTIYQVSLESPNGELGRETINKGKRCASKPETNEEKTQMTDGAEARARTHYM
uniref:Uncharacterized protein n=1 Tax=Utricularia reniformis TaxID=192314 RepID=A0A1Y0B1Q5_9LAMI|nr:hypothetical protein AEK19_MT1173 [Utricularia reniformis]ART31386.1 hypothetical protein AEK19_MT1173 [Utricularia reniformis]